MTEPTASAPPAHAATPFPVSEPARLARLAGGLYLVIIVSGVLGEGLLRAPLVDMSDAAATAAQLKGASLGFRIGILSDVVMALADVGLAVAMFGLLAPLGPLLSLSAMAFRLVQAAVIGQNLVHLHRAAALAEQGQAAAEVLHQLDAHALGYDLALFFFGVNCLLTAVLLRRATTLPRYLAPMLAAAAAVYLVGSTIHVVVPAASAAVAPAYVVCLIAELAVALWLLRGARGLDPSSRP